MRVGIIGLGSIGTRHAKNAMFLGHELVAYDAVTVKPMALPEGSPVKIVRSVRDVVTERPDAVMICTPAETHAHVARQLLAANYPGPLFCEKPLALSVEDCAVFREWPHPTTMVGYNLRFHPVAKALKLMGPSSIGWFSCYCDNRKYGSDVFELSHEYDLATWLGLSPVCVKVEGDSPYYLRHWEVRSAQTSHTTRFHSPEELGTQMYVDELAHFLDCAAKGIPTITPFADGIRVVDVCEQAVKLANA